MKKKIYLIGAGGHSRMLLTVLELNKFKIGGIYDNNFKDNETINEYKIIGGLKDIRKDDILFLSIGDCSERECLFNQYRRQIWQGNIMHPNAIVEKRTEMGRSNQLFAGSYINANVKIGNNNILNTRSILEHEVAIGSHNHISVGAIVCGRVTIEDKCFIGAGAVVIDKIKICSNVIVGANSVVISDIKEAGTYAGNPARRIK